jgi:multidrug resistance efflux pump
LLPQGRPIIKSLAVVGVVAVLAAGGYAYHRIVSVEGPVRLTGVVAVNQVVVSSQIGGSIEELRVDEGTRVEKDDVLARLSRDELEAEQRQQAAMIRQLSSKLAQDRERERLERERVRSRAARAEADLRLALSRLDEARAEHAQRAKDLDYNQTLGREGLMPAQEHEQVATKLRVADARVRSAEDQIQAAEAEVELVRANERQVQLSVLDVEQTRAQLEQARAEQARIEARLGYTEIRAPSSGMVSLRVASEGEIVKVGDPIVTIVDLENVWVRTAVEESLIGRLQLGDKLRVRLASGDELEGEVTFIAPEAGFATQRDVNRVKRDIRTFGIKVSVPNPDHRVHPGMTAYVFLKSQSGPR